MAMAMAIEGMDDRRANRRARLTMLTVRQVDRFIPSRSALDLDVAHYNLSREGGESEVDDAVKEIKSPAKVRASTRSKRARTNAWSE